MVTYFPQPNTNMPIGCDFCGIVEDGNEDIIASFPRGTRVCGGTFPYAHAEDPANLVSGAFAEYVAADANQLLRVPDAWDDLQSASVGLICWGTCIGALFADPEALSLAGRPSEPADKGVPVVVYGGATATGTMACQLLKLSGHYPIAVTSTASAPLARKYGAVGTAAYTSPTCAETVRSLSPGGRPIRHVMDCITTAESVSISFAAIGRAGGRYACLESLDPSWLTRKAIHTREVMGFEAMGRDVSFMGGENTTYSRDANLQLYARGVKWTAELQVAVDTGKILPHPVREVGGGGSWEERIIRGLGILRRGEVKRERLVVRVAGSADW
ncbi:hypothetical protein DL770_008215 [Monosporascus sp. CRB-9-2]|nr:hypothetical protein DL770_008215 [Monosporascus sp. CRB-9-2]